MTPTWKTPEYRAWGAMIQRCTNRKRHNYSRYAGRGITICTRWRRSFKEFLGDVGRKPTAAHSIERIDNNKSYFKGNVRWATKLEQANNRCNSKWVTYRGKKLTISQLARKVRVKRATINGRLLAGLSVEEAVRAPFDGCEMRHKFRGKLMGLPAIAKLCKVGYDTLRYRVVEKKMSIDKATTMRKWARE